MQMGQRKSLSVRSANTTAHIQACRWQLGAQTELASRTWSCGARGVAHQEEEGSHRVLQTAWSAAIASRSSQAARAAGGGDGGGDGGAFDGSGDSNDEGDDDRIIGFDEAVALAAAAGSQLPKDFLSLAASEGIRLSVVEAFVNLQNNAFAGWLARTIPWFRDRLIFDDRFLFKVLAEIVIDSGCATIAEVQKRGAEFWDEFEFYLSDLIVGLVLDVVLVGLLAPTAVLGRKKPKSVSSVGKILDRIPSAVFQANVPGAPPYGVASRIGCIGVKFLEYSLAGMACGLVGQGIANAAMIAKRNMHPDAVYTVAPPNLVNTALTWGLFMGLSSNLRYQAVVGLERVVDLTIAKKVPQVAYATTVAIRFINNIIGGMHYIDMARWTGVQ